ncbi:hypothetical protein [Cupriavidus malaysiensis]|uniref:hypothetical protein n=1 Tax=Cupriavidus malaysiensis TaxID=367825 RepID=UPI0012FF5AD2|nr:hypothetical protein [Cupriavidus malaysiensis]
MRESVKVHVQWLPEKMVNLPSSNTYSTVAKFPEDAATWPNEAWSVVLEFDSPEIAHAVSFNATARFLMPTAPFERLKPGCVFELYEGFKRTAIVRVL